MSSDDSNIPRPILIRHMSESCLSSSPESSRDPSLSIPSSELHARASSSSLGQSTTSTTNVTFAPLPVVEKKKRRHPSFQYGVGTRSLILRHRHTTPLFDNAVENRPLPRPHSPVRITETEVRGDEDNDTRSDEPVLALGRLMKGVWRRVSSKPGRDSAQTEKIRDVPSTRQPHAFHHGKEGSAILTDDHVEEEGRVWEEEISEEFQKRFKREEPKLLDEGADGVIPQMMSTVQAL